MRVLASRYSHSRLRPILQEERSIFTPRLLSLRQEIRYLSRFPEVNNVSQFRLCLHARARVLRDIEILLLLEILSRCYRSLSYAILTRVILNRHEESRNIKNRLDNREKRRRRGCNLRYSGRSRDMKEIGRETYKRLAYLFIFSTFRGS